MLWTDSKLPGMRFYLGSRRTGGVRSSGAGRCGSASLGEALVDSLGYRSPMALTDAYLFGWGNAASPIPWLPTIIHGGFDF